jgi:hypothetical protein
MSGGVHGHNLQIPAVYYTARSDAWNNVPETREGPRRGKPHPSLFPEQDQYELKGCFINLGNPNDLERWRSSWRCRKCGTRF